MATSQASASNAESSSNEHVMASAVTLPPAAETSLNRGKRRIVDGKDLERACLEQEIEDLKAECKKMRLVHESQLGITTVLRSKNQSLENELAHAKRKIASLEKQLAAAGVKTSQQQEDKFSYVTQRGLEETSLVQRGSQM